MLLTDSRVDARPAMVYLSVRPPPTGIGGNAGDAWLSRLVSARHLERMKKRFEKAVVGTVVSAVLWRRTRPEPRRARTH